MCARRPTSAMPKPFLCCERAFCCSMVVMCRGVRWSNQGTTPVLLCTAKYYSSTTLYCKVLLQYYYTVLQRTTPVLLCTTKYYSVLQSTTPVRLCTTKYYSSTTLYYKVLLQYYSVLQSTTPVLRCTTQYYNVLLQYYTVLQSSIHDWCPSHMKRHLQCAEQQESSSNITKYCTYHAKWLWWLIRVTYETSFNLQWAEQQESQSIFTKYCTCHAKWMPSVIRVTYETSFPMRGASKVTLQTHQLLRLPRKMNLMIDPRHIWNVIYNARSNRVDASNFTKYCACHAKCISWLIRVSYETSFRMRGASKVNLEPHQILRLPRKMNLMIDPRLIWNGISNAQSKQSQPPTSANTAPATQNESHD